MLTFYVLAGSVYALSEAKKNRRGVGTGWLRAPNGQRKISRWRAVADGYDRIFHANFLFIFSGLTGGFLGCCSTPHFQGGSPTEIPLNSVIAVASRRKLGSVAHLRQGVE
jgi:hypothetical protein